MLVKHSARNQAVARMLVKQSAGNELVARMLVKHSAGNEPVARGRGTLGTGPGGNLSGKLKENLKI